MTREIKITQKFNEEDVNCPVTGQCRQMGICLKALTILDEIVYWLKNPEDSTLVFQLKDRTCQHPQALEMYEKAEEILDEI